MKFVNEPLLAPCLRSPGRRITCTCQPTHQATPRHQPNGHQPTDGWPPFTSPDTVTPLRFAAQQRSPGQPAPASCPSPCPQPVPGSPTRWHTTSHPPHTALQAARHPYSGIGRPVYVAPRGSQGVYAGHGLRAERKGKPCRIRSPMPGLIRLVAICPNPSPALSHMSTSAPAAPACSHMSDSRAGLSTMSESRINQPAQGLCTTMSDSPAGSCVMSDSALGRVLCPFPCADTAHHDKQHSQP